MQSTAHAASVIAYYDAHPINEQQILHTLRARGIALEGLTEEILKDHDQDHFGGIEANDLLITKAGIARDHVVLDVCSGMGGPARYLAQRVGCRVAGLDFTRQPSSGGTTPDQAGRTGPSGQLPARQCAGHAVRGCKLRRGDRTGGLVSRPRKAAPDRRVRAGGQARRGHCLHRYPAQGCALGGGDGAPDARDDLPDASSPWTATRRCSESRGCSVLARDDLSEHWARILVQRLAMYRGLEG